MLGDIVGEYSLSYSFSRTVFNDYFQYIPIFPLQVLLSEIYIFHFLFSFHGVKPQGLFVEDKYLVFK